MNLLKLYSFRMPRNILFGLNAVDKTGERAAGLGGKKALLVTDKILHTTGAIAKAEDSLKKTGVGVGVYDEVVTEPTTDQVNKGAEVFKSQACNLVIGLGGGACINAAKGIAVLGTNPGVITDYEGRGKVKKRTSPLIALPTTAGTASEITWVTVIYDATRDVKFLVYSPYIVPEEAIEDPV